MANDFDQLPADLINQLRQSAQTPSSIPVELDAVILHDASSSISRRRRLRKMILAAASLSAAACLTIFGTLWFSAQSYDPDDINHDGRISIADAFTLARKQAAGDATITQQRIDQLALASVRLDNSGGAAR